MGRKHLFYVENKFQKETKRMSLIKKSQLKEKDEKIQPNLDLNLMQLRTKNHVVAINSSLIIA